MYAAYQSHQSCGGATASNEPCCSAVSCSSSARAATSMSVLPLPAGEPGRDLLEHPAVAIRVAERCLREVRASLRRFDARGPPLLHRADIDAAADEVVAGGVDVVDHEDHALGGARLSRRAALAELDRARRVRRRHLHRAEVVADDQVDVEPPSEALIEALRAIDIGDGDLHDLQGHVDRAQWRRLGRSDTAYV